MLLQISQRVLVDLDQRDVLACCGGIRGFREAPVVGLELYRAKRLEVRQRHHEAGSACPDE